MVTTIPVYSEQDLTPRAMEVIRAIVDSEFGEGEIKFSDEGWWGNRVLVFGRGPESDWHNVEFVYTYSIAQIMSKANAATVLIASIKQVLNKPDPIPFIEPLGASSLLGSTWDFDAPTAIDIETSGNLGKTHTPEEVGLISVAFYQPGKAPMVWVGEETNAEFSYIQIKQLREFIVKFKYGIYHNGKFDTRVLNRILGVNLCVWFDTMLAHHVLNHAAGDHKLKPTARRYCGAPDWEAGLGQWTKNGGHYELIPTDKLIEYNGWDVYWTFKLFEIFAPLIMADENNVKALTLEMQAAEFLLDVEMAGIPFDDFYAVNYADVLAIRQSGVTKDLRSMLGYELNPNSPKQVKEYYESIGLPLRSTDEATLQELLDNPELNTWVRNVTENILKYRKLGKIRGTYCEGWLSKSRNGRVHPTFLVHGTSTGRLSSTSPNAQNVPRDKEIRKLVKILG